MDDIEYALMNKADATMWWYQCLHELTLLCLARHLATDAPFILDAGCGTGGLMLRLQQAWPRATICGVDLSETACRWTRAKTAAATATARVDCLPFRDADMDLVLSTDVLSIAGVDEAAAMAEAHRCLKKGGLYLVNYPAYAWLTADHDRQVCTARRTTAGALRQRLCGAGFRPVFVTYWNMVLFPLMVARRKLWRGSDTSDVGRFSGLGNQLLASLCGLERLVLGRNIPLPFGGSVLALAVKS